MISLKVKGDFKKTERYLTRVRKVPIRNVLEKYGKKGVQALASATPLDTGETAGAWSYEIENKNGSYSISFVNSNVNKGVRIAIILQYGHGTGTGGWVEGRDYINPAIQPIFDELTEEAWREVTKL